MTDEPESTPDDASPPVSGTPANEAGAPSGADTVGSSNEPTGEKPAESSGEKPAEAAPKAPGSPDSRKLLIAVLALFAVALVAVGIGLARKNKDTSSSSATSTSTTKAGSTGTGNCVAGTWPALYTNQPGNLAAATDAGYYLWNDAKGWHLRVLDPSGQTTFTGAITSAVKLDPKKVKVTPDGSGTVNVTSNSVTFEFKGSGTPAGADFEVGCAADRFSLSAATKAGLPWPIAQIYVGKDGKAVSNPVVVTKQGA